MRPASNSPMSYPLSDIVRDRIDYSAFGEEPHAMEEGEWRFLVGEPPRELVIVGFYAAAARSAFDEARDGEAVRLVKSAPL